MNKISTAICSYGMSGFVFHAPFLHVHPGFDFYGVWERSKNEAEKRYPYVKTFRHFEDLLQDEKIELVVVNTPSVTHYEFAKEALKKGKHVIVEKPFTADVGEARELIELAQSSNLLLSVYHNRRFDSDYMTVKKVLDEGLLGEIVDVEMRYDRFDPKLSYKVHKETPTKAVGSLYDLGSHLIDQALSLFGMPDSVFLDQAYVRPNSKVDDYFDLKLYYPSHRVSLKSSYYVRESTPSFVFHGRNGSFVKTRGDIQEATLKEGILPNEDFFGLEPDSQKGILHTEVDGKVIREAYPTQKGQYMSYYNSVYDALRNKAKLPVTAEEGLQVIQIIQAAKKSAIEKKVIDLNI